MPRPDELGGSHASLVPEGAPVRAAGKIEITEDGHVNANAWSGHFMEGKPLDCGETQAWQQGMTGFIEGVGLKVLELGEMPEIL